MGDFTDTFSMEGEGAVVLLISILKVVSNDSSIYTHSLPLNIFEQKICFECARPEKGLKKTWIGS